MNIATVTITPPLTTTLEQDVMVLNALASANNKLSSSDIDRVAKKVLKAIEAKYQRDSNDSVQQSN